MKTIYKKKDPQDISSIPNKQIEQMFLSIADDDMMKEFNTLVSKGLTGTATAYASHRVYKFFMYWRDSFIKNGGDLDYLGYMLYRKEKK